MSQEKIPNTPHFLCDTWWYGLSQRLPENRFNDLVEIRAKQGFDAVQLVVGIPPEVGPENFNASSDIGPAWKLNGEFNQKYLDEARKKIQSLNSHGISVIIYGAWGQQIEWLGQEKMKSWWNEIIKKFDDLNVMYCITGESDLWVGEEKNLLPNRTTDELGTTQLASFLPSKITNLGKKVIRLMNEPLNKYKAEERREKWSDVLDFVSDKTSKPVIIHPLPNRNSEQVVNNPELLDAVTVQTGHDPQTRKTIWQSAFDSSKNFPAKPFINLEPWYEGIKDQFGINDQLYSYWASMMAGAHAYCYGAHGVWNVGDGKFLAHWGRQTLDEAITLDTPRLIGISHKLFVTSGFMDYKKVEVEEKGGELIKITRTNDRGDWVCYVPELSLTNDLPKGEIFLPLTASYVKEWPKSGQAVIIQTLWGQK